MIKLWFSTRYW